MGRFLYADEGPHACEGDGRESLQNGCGIKYNDLIISKINGVKKLRMSDVFRNFTL